MKFKVHGVQFDERFPIMVTLTEQDKETIRNMPKEATRLASFPAGWGDKDEMDSWMDNPGELQENFANGI